MPDFDPRRSPRGAQHIRWDFYRHGGPYTLFARLELSQPSATEEQMLATYKGCQITGEIFGGVGDIFNPSHAAHRPSRLDILPEMLIHAISEDTGTFDGRRNDRIDSYASVADLHR